MAKANQPSRRKLAAERRKRRARIEVVLERLGERYEHPTWAGGRLDAVDELVLTILAQNTADVNSHRAFVALRERYPTWSDVLAAPTDELTDVIRPGGLAPTKAPRIQHVLAEVLDRRGSFDLSFLASLPVEEARDWLDSLPGIGRKTASIVLMFCFGMPSLPVDTHIYRVAHRLGLLPPKADLLKAHQLLEDALEPDEMYAFHVEMIRHGRDTCRAPRPICALCPLTDICDYYVLVQRGKAPVAPPPRSALLEESRAPRYHDELLHGWTPPEADDRPEAEA
jgi:endonuclease-3